MAFDALAMQRRALITPERMALADQRTIDAGTPRSILIERAARAVLRVLRSRYLRRPTTVLCGPGQNGEDGLLLAALLAEAEWPLTVVMSDDTDETRAPVLNSLSPYLRPSGTFAPAEGALVVDALFGAGLNRDIDGEAAKLIERMNQSPAKVLSIDLPSGIDGATGEVRGTAVYADASVTFHRLKPGHLMGEGALRSGDVFLEDIGIAPDPEDATAVHNHPDLWQSAFGSVEREVHKYQRGHVMVLGGPGLKGGAARLSARMASLSGAGAVTYLAPLSAAEYAASSFDAVMVRPVPDPETFGELIEDKAASLVLGPGMGHGKLAKACLTVALESGIPCVLDADALTLYEDEPETLLSMLHTNCVLTPHEGEFKRLFSDAAGDKLTRTREAALAAGATVLLKGATTAIVGGGTSVLNTNAGPALATAGSGDVLAGLIGGLMAQGLGPQEAASAGAWIHGEAGRQASRSLSADQLPKRVADVLARFLAV